MKVTFKTDFSRNARAASEKAAAAVFQILNARFQAALAAPVYSWPRQTIRKDGSVAGSPRNIIDQGNSGGILGSNTGPEINGLRVRYTWRVPHAAAVHEGYVTEKGTLVPARPWTGAVLGTEPVSGIEPFDYRQAFKTIWLAKFKGG